MSWFNFKDGKLVPDPFTIMGNEIITRYFDI